MAESPSRRKFTELVARADAAVDLAEGALLIACEEYPDLQVPLYLARLDEMAAELLHRIGGEKAPEARADALNRYLFQELGFKGNDQDYYDPRNSFLNDVLDRRTGIPITLSTVYLELARRVGVPAAGVGLPGHFIVKVGSRGREVLIDPFHGGALLTRQDCQERLDRIFGGKLKVAPPMLAACERKQMLARMLHNLKAIYDKRSDHVRALGVVELLLCLDPKSAEDLRDRGLLYAALECYAFAVRDLEAYVERVPGSPEAIELLERIAAMRQRAARLN